ncbi:unnamed protein product [Rotaria socialis]|uniref:G-protein coupled receptors family 1 profile domain-containing protein n=1 Tax=Rotaria socialis TaxID=392032 RepID=A0A817T3Y4_9BILA|nr:unnamed protein product [Rotaria socialis]CAF3316300.1 unnamed protein product [Rotaria socialis]CAF3368605.1 unnamed protein product [Rotaria socialis]CAF3415642.1 unnamed protein product [Rotaria socialis]
MAYDDGSTFWSLNLHNETTKTNECNRFNYSIGPTEAVLIAFHIGRIISIVCITFGSLGNITLIFAICHTSFYHFPYGLLLLFISTFDIIRLISTAFYYLMQSNTIPLKLSTITIYITLSRYSKIVTNWLKVILAVERLIAVKYWIARRYNVNSNNSKRIHRLRQRKLLLLILILLFCSLISQHPNLLPKRFISTCICPSRLLVINTPNPYLYYLNKAFNEFLFTIISYVIFDNVLPIMILIIFNTILLYELKRLPPTTSKKLAESILILFFLTIFSMLVLPRSVFVIFNLYTSSNIIKNIILAVIFHIFQGLELINHAITGYACFLSCYSLRKDLIQNIRMIAKKFRRQNNRLKSYTIELPTISPERL